MSTFEMLFRKFIVDSFLSLIFQPNFHVIHKLIEANLKFTDRLSSNETGALWIPFQTAAGTVTTLYKGN